MRILYTHCIIISNYNINLEDNLIPILRIYLYYNTKDPTTAYIVYTASENTNNFSHEYHIFFNLVLYSSVQK